MFRQGPNHQIPKISQNAWCQSSQIQVLLVGALPRCRVWGPCPYLVWPPRQCNQGPAGRRRTKSAGKFRQLAVGPIFCCVEVKSEVIIFASHSRLKICYFLDSDSALVKVSFFWWLFMFYDFSTSDLYLSQLAGSGPRVPRILSQTAPPTVL